MAESESTALFFTKLSDLEDLHRAAWSSYVTGLIVKAFAISKDTMKAQVSSIGYDVHADTERFMPAIVTQVELANMGRYVL